MPIPQFLTGQDTQQAFDTSQASLESGRAARLAAIGQALNDEEKARDMTTSVGVDQAIRQSYTANQQPGQVSQDPSGAQNLTSGQQQVQAIPVSADPAAPQAAVSGPPIQLAQVNASDMQPPAGATSALSKQGIPVPPAPSAFQGVGTNGGPEAANIVPGQPYQIPGAPPAGTAAAAPAPMPPPQKPPIPATQATPFDSPQFQQSLSDHLASVPGAGQELMKVKAQRDAVLGNIMQMIAQGNTDEAQFTAQRNGFNIPPQFYQNADLAAGMTYAQKAYPDDPDKGQAFFQTFMNTPGSHNEKVQAGMAAAGVPSSLGQKEIAKALALGRMNYLTANGQLVNVNPLTHTATPYTDPSGGAVNVQAGYGLHMPGVGSGGGARGRFMNVGGQLVDTQHLDAQGHPTVVVPRNADPQTAILNLTGKIMQSGINVKPADAAAQARQIYYSTQNQGGSALGAQMPAPAPIQFKGPALDTSENPSGVQPSAMPAGGAQGGMVHVQGPAGDKYWIQPTDLNDALRDGYQQVQ